MKRNDPRRVKQWLFAMLLLALFIPGCGAPEAPEKSAQEPAPQAEPKQQPATEEKQPEKPAESGQPNGWDQIVEAAKKEGKLVISGAPSERYRTALVDAFQAKYPEIAIEYVGLNGRDFWPKLLQERKLDQYLWDLRMGGPDAVGWEKAREITVPIRPILQPENADDAAWLGGLDGLFVDKENQYVPGFFAYSANPVSVNRDFISESELTSPEGLLDPKFKGKIVLNDPRGGAGLGYLAVLYQFYGEEFVKELLTKQEIVVTSDNRQLVEWVVRGRYPIGIGFDSTNLETFQEKGLGLNIKELEEGPLGLSMGFGAINFLDKAPNPNAAKVYINWILSEEGQKVQAEVLKLNSRRIGVALGDAKVEVKPDRLDRYISHQEEEMAETRTKVRKLADELIK